MKFIDFLKKNVGITISGFVFLAHSLVGLYFIIVFGPKLFEESSILMLLFSIGITLFYTLLGYGLLKYKKWAGEQGRYTAGVNILALGLSFIAVDIKGFLLILIIILIALNILSNILLLLNNQQFKEISEEIYTKS